MSRVRLAAARLACLFLACCAYPAAAATPDPLRLVPAQADLVLTVEQPRHLVEIGAALEPLQQLYQLEALREYFDSTNVRRLNQLVAYFEKALGAPRLELLDRLAGGGIAAALKFAPDPTPALLVIQGKDEKLLRQFVKLAVEVAQEELARQDKGRPETIAYRGIDCIQFGDKLTVAVVGSALLVGNPVATVRAAIDLHLDGPHNSLGSSPRLAEGRRLLTGAPLAWLWLNFDKLREQPQFKVVFETLTAEPTSALVLGGLPDVFRRTPCLAAGFYREADGFSLRLRYPRGRDGMSALTQLVLPAADDAPPPLLEPKNVQFSVSYFLDLGKAYANRTKFLSKGGQKGLQELEKNAGVFGAAKLAEILNLAGPHQRVIGTKQEGASVNKGTKQTLDAFALVQEMREPAFAKALDGVLRAAGLFATLKFKYKRVEEKCGEHLLVSYRAPDDFKEKKAKANEVIFGLPSPSYGYVGNQFFAANTVELGRELIDLLQKEASAKTNRPASGLRAQYYWSGLAASLRSGQQQILTQAVLAQALDPEVARKQVELLIHVVEGLGTVRLDSTYERAVTRYDFRLTLSKLGCCDE
jgi:hypothetical protein